MQTPRRWLPAVLMMGIIFAFSAQPSENLYSLKIMDKLVKKGGHVVGYALLALSYYRGLRETKNPHALAWLLTIVYAATDEIHQSFVPGRHASIWDVVIFDNLGAITALVFHQRQWIKCKKKLIGS